MYCLVFGSLALVSAVNFNHELFSNRSREANYESFLQRHSHRKGTSDPVSYELRRDLYHSRLAEVAAHNHQGRSWEAEVNRFADYTDQERHALLGYKRGARNDPGNLGLSFLQVQPMVKNKHKAAAEVDWRQHLPHSKSFLRDQGHCGSCWAVAAAGALEMQAEILTGKTTKVAVNQLVDCVENLKHCGGTGGCDGATAELAFEFVAKHGLFSDTAYDANGGGCQSTGRPVLTTTSWNRLPTNEGEPLRVALTNVGPAVVSVDGSKWFMYRKGVFDGCEKDAVVNHAVLMTGYGKQGQRDYWTIRNSWGDSWGEDGYIRLLRHANDNDYCGIDRKPQEGVGCDGGPKELPVCGMCGVLADSSHPVGAKMHIGAI